jgi:PAS domain S-box-containing protein
VASSSEDEAEGQEVIRWPRATHWAKLDSLARRCEPFVTPTGTSCMPRNSGSPRVDSRMGTATLTDADLRLLVSRVKDYAIFMLDPMGNVASWNEGAERIKGYTADDIIGKHMSTFYLPDQAAAGHPSELLNKAKSDGRVEEEGWRVRKDGTRFWADVVITALRNDDGELRGFAKVTRDLTERRNAEITLSELSGRLLRIQDEERRRIGRELHDTTSPLLTSLTGKLYTGRQRARTISSDLHTLMEEALALAEATATMVRTVSSLLHPPLLDQSGFLAALKWYLDTLSSRSGLRVDAKLPEGMERLTSEQDVALFRMVQEWLTGTMSLGSRSVTVQVVSGSDELEVSVDSAGVGLDAVSEPGTQLAVTVEAMRARLRQLGGDIVVAPSKAGVMITTSLPTSRE